MTSVLIRSTTRPASALVLAQAGRLEVRMADTAPEVEQAMKLRYRVFASEMGARLDGDSGLDRDGLDPWCRHLIAVDADSGEVIGTYRVLLPEQAKAAGCLYADREFDLRNLDPVRHDLVELGRACIAPGYRNGVVLMLLWRAMRAFVATYGHQYVIGCCSVSLADGGADAARLYRQLEAEHPIDPRWQVYPRHRLDLDRLAPVGAAACLEGPEAAPVDVPALLKGYLKAGARILGEPHVDPQFGCADFPIMLEVGALNPRLVERMRRG
ncbi:MAG: GNAT family N-acetyltransferase [Lautropia sp.]